MLQVECPITPKKTTYEERAYDNEKIKEFTKNSRKALIDDILYYGHV